MHIVFVHGTGVREPTFSETLATVRSGLTEAMPDSVIHPCYWAGKHGSNVGEGLSIPLYDQSLAVGDDAHLDTDLAEWTLLLDDPLLELRMLAAHPTADDGVPGLKPGAMLVTRAIQFLNEVDAAPVAMLSKIEQEAYRTSLAAILGFDQLADAVNAGIEINQKGAHGLNALRALMAKAVVAGWMSGLLDGAHAIPLADRRDLLVEWTYKGLGGDDIQLMATGDALRTALLAPFKFVLSKVVVNPALRAASWGGKRYRHSLVDIASPAAGDVMLYQARGQAIREFIHQTAADVQQPVVLLAHSLGGIACIDMLIERSPEFVKGVITAGSQAPYFYEIGALTQRAKDKAMPDHMPPWLNFYDKNDLLSFMAAPVMTGAHNVVKDVEVRSGQPFPASHSAYWSNPDVWRESADFMLSL